MTTVSMMIMVHGRAIFSVESRERCNTCLDERLWVSCLVIG